MFPLATHCKPVSTVGHELYHLHFWDNLEHLGIKINEDTMKKLWSLSEVVVNFVLQKIKIGGMGFETHIYEEQKELYEKLKPMKKTDFQKFLSISAKGA